MATGTQRRTITSDNKSSSTKKLYVYDISGVGSRTPSEYLNTTTNSSLPSSTTTKKVSSRSYWGPLKKLTTTTTSKPSSIHKKKNSNANDIPVPEVEEMKFVHHQPRYAPVKLLDHHREIRRRSVSQVEGRYLTKSNNEVLKKSTKPPPPPPVVKINDPALRQPPPVGETTTTKRIMYKNVHERKLLGEEEDYNVGVRVVTGRTSVSHVENNVAIVGVRRLGGSMIVQQGRKSSDWKLELEEEAKLLQVKVLVTDMAGFMQVHAFRCARNTYDSLETFSAKTLAFNLKKEFDKVYGPAWHCIVGSSFGSFVTHATGCFLYFSMDKLYVLLFRTKVRKVVED